MIAMAIDLATLAYSKITGDKLESTNTIPNDYSIVIPAYNEEKLITPAVLSIYEQTKLPKNVFIVDDCSKDSTQQVCEQLANQFPDLTYIRQERNMGKAYNINQVVREYEKDLGEVTVVIDSDTVLHPKCLEILLDDFSYKDVAAVTGSSSNQSGDSLMCKLLHQGRQYRFSVFRFRKNAQSLRNAVFVVNGGCSAYRTEILREIPFPNRTKTEDTDHTWTLLERGYRVIYEPKSLCWYVDPGTVKGHFNQLYRWFSGTHQCLYYHWKEMFRSKPLSLTTIVPSFYQSFYAYTIVSLPLIALRSPEVAAGIVVGDLTLSLFFGTVIGQRPKVDKKGNWHYHSKNPIKRCATNFIDTAQKLPGLAFFSYLSSIAWTCAELKTVYDILTRRTSSWTKGGWARPDDKLGIDTEGKPVSRQPLSGVESIGIGDTN